MIETKSASSFIAGALVATVAVGGMQIAAASGTRTIHACSAKSGGALRVASHCKRSENSISWNQKGAPGPRGRTGPAGAIAAYTAGPTSLVSINDSNEHTVVSLNIPAAGKYVLNVDLLMYNGDPTHHSAMFCQFVGPGLDVESVPVDVSPTDQSEGTTYVSETFGIAVPSGGGTYDANCLLGGGPGVGSKDDTMSAVRVSTLG